MTSMRYRRSTGEKLLDGLNLTALLVVSVVALYPFVYVLGLSLATPTALARADWWLWPSETSWVSYELVLADARVRSGFLNTVLRTILGTAATLAMTALLAYPLSRPRLPWRRALVFYLLFTMLFSGGLVPRYLLVRGLGLIDTMAALILPLMLTAFNVFILRGFFQQIPDDYEEAARLDGAGDLSILWRIFIPLSKPALVTIGLWTGVAHWNYWLDALIYITSEERQVLQVVIQSLVIENNLMEMQFGVSGIERHRVAPDGLKSAAVVVSVLPIVLIYPFVQRYFLKGIQLGGIKG